MGLDSIELLLAIEEEFGISIEDADAENLTTPRLLADHIVSRMNKTDISEFRCLSQMQFYRIRSALIQLFGASRKEVKRQSPVSHFLTGNIRKQWYQLRSALNAKDFPELQCRNSWYFSITLGIPTMLVALMLWTGYQFVATVFTFVVAWIASHAITKKFADVLPVTTVDELVPYVRFKNIPQLDYSTVLQRIIQITSDQLCISAEQIKPDHHFVKDLGMG